MKDHRISISSLLVAVFGALGVHYVYIQVFLKEQGFSYQQIGFLLAVIPLVAMFAAPLWGMVVDSSRDPRRILRLLLILAPGCHVLLLMGGSFPVCLAVCVCIALFYRPLIPVQDSLVLRALHLYGGDYGRLRIWGSVGFAVPALFLPLLWGKVEMGSINWTVPALVFGTYSLLGVGLSLWFPEVPPMKKHGLSLSGFRLFSNRTFLVLLGCTSLARLASSSLDGYQTLYFQEKGVPVSDLALYLSLGPLSEVVTIFYSQRWLAKVGARWLMALCLGALAVRLFVTSSASSHWVLVLIQVLHCFTFGTQHVVTILVVNQLAGDSIRASGQTLLSMFSGHLSTLVGLVFSGWIAGALGISSLFGISSGMAFVSLLVWLLLYSETGDATLKDGIR